MRVESNDGQDTGDRNSEASEATSVVYGYVMRSHDDP